MINLLPWRERKKQQHQRHFIFLLCVINSIIIVAFCLCRWDITKKTMQLKNTIQSLQMRIQQIPLNHLKQNAALLANFTKTKTALLVTIKNNHDIAQLLSTLAIHLPDNMIFTALSLHNNKITLSGVGNNLSDIHAYLAAIQHELPHHKLSLSEIQNDAKIPTHLHFTITENP